MKLKLQRNKLTAWLLTFAMIITMLSGFTLSASAEDSGSDDSGSVDGTEKAVGDTITVTGNITVTAVWEEDKNADEGDDDTTTYEAALYNSNNTLIKNYKTLAEAITAASQNTGSTVKLLNNVTLDSYMLIDSGEFTIDLGEFTVSCSSDYVFDIRNSGTKITFKGGTNGTVQSTESDCAAIAAWFDAAVIVESGTYSGDYGFDTCGGSAAVTINGGTFIAAADGVIFVGGDSTVTINGGTFKAADDNDDFCASVFVDGDDPTLTVKGGTFEQGSYGHFAYVSGTLDLSACTPDESETALTDITVCNFVKNAAVGTNIKLPEGYGLFSNGTEYTSLAEDTTYTIGTVSSGDDDNEDAVPAITNITFNTDSSQYDVATNTFTVTENESFVVYLTGENFNLIDDSFLEKAVFGFLPSMENTEQALGNTLYVFNELDFVSVDKEANKITLTFGYTPMKAFLEEYGKFKGIGYGNAGIIKDIKAVTVVLKKSDETTETDVSALYVGGVDATANPEGTGWNFDADTNTLTLNGAEIDTYYLYDSDTTLAGIYAVGDLNIVLKGENSIEITETLSKNGIAVDGNLNISGDGNLNISLTDNPASDEGDTFTNGLYVKGELTIDDGMLEIYAGDSSAACGVFAVEFTMNGGSLDVECGKSYTDLNSGIQSDTDITINGGSINVKGNDSGRSFSLGIGARKNIYINGGTVTAKSGKAVNHASDGMYAHNFYIKGGTVTAEGNYSKNYSYGIFAVEAFVIEDGTVNAKGGNSDYLSNGVCAEEKLTASGGTLKAESGEEAGTYSFGVFAVELAMTGGTVTGTAYDSGRMSNGIETEKIDVSGGTLTGMAHVENAEYANGISAELVLNVSGKGKVIAQCDGVGSMAGSSTIYVGDYEDETKDDGIYISDTHYITGTDTEYYDGINEINQNAAGTAVKILPYPKAEELNLSVTAGVGMVTLVWDALDYEDVTYTVYFYTEEDDSYTEYGGEPVYNEEDNTYTLEITGLENDVTYSIGISTECDAWGEDYSISAEADVSPYAEGSTVPDAPVIKSATAGNGTITVSWAAPENNGGAKILGYEIEVVPADAEDVNGGMTIAVDADKTSYAIEELENEVTYNITVCAINSVGRSEYSEAATATPKKPSSGGGSSSSTTTTTTKNEDGSTTKTTVNKATGATTEVTTNTDGSTTTIVTKKDGTVTTTEKDVDGNTTTTVENPDGSSTTTEERKDGTMVTTETTADGETKSKIDVPANKETEVIIPTPNAENVTSVVVTDKDGNEIEITDFEITENGVKISISGDCTVSLGKSVKKIFDDVHPVNHWAAENVDYVYINGLMMGTSETHFSPDAPLTRAMLVTVLYRNEGEPEITGTTSFEDVDDNAYYAKAVVWGQQNGIIKGYSETEFAPDDNITREQIAAIMFRYAQYKGMDAVTLEENLHFADSSEISEYAVSAMNWAVGTGLMKGKSTTTINPKDNATRAEIAVILERFIKAN